MQALMVSWEAVQVTPLPLCSMRMWSRSVAGFKATAMAVLSVLAVATAGRGPVVPALGMISYAPATPIPLGPALLPQSENSLMPVGGVNVALPLRVEK